MGVNEKLYTCINELINYTFETSIIFLHNTFQNKEIMHFKNLKRSNLFLLLNTSELKFVLL